MTDPPSWWDCPPWPNRWTEMNCAMIEQPRRRDIPVFKRSRVTPLTEPSRTTLTERSGRRKCLNGCAVKQKGMSL